LPAGPDQDCLRHPRINQRRANQSGGEGERGGGERGRDGDTAMAQKNSRPPRRKSYSGLARDCPLPSPFTNRGGFAPSMNKQPVLRLFRALSLSLSLPPSFLPPTVLPAFPPPCPSEREREREREREGHGLLIYDRTWTLYSSQVPRFT